MQLKERQMQQELANITKAVTLKSEILKAKRKYQKELKMKVEQAKYLRKKYINTGKQNLAGYFFIYIEL